MLGKSVCLLLSGKAGVGKTTSASWIKELLEPTYDVCRASFATGVKTAAKKCFAWDGKKDPKGRQLLQDVGQTGRRYNPNIWVAQTFEEFIPKENGYPFDFVVIDDWRFPNEHDYILDNQPLYSVYTIRIDAPKREMLLGTEQYNDISEVSLDDYKFDFYVDNSVDDISHLVLQYQEILGEILVRENNYGTK